MKKVKTYVLYILDSDLAYEDERLEELQNELDNDIGAPNSGLTVNYTPMNEVSKYTVGIWALAKTETENKDIIDQIECILKSKKLTYSKSETYVILDGETWYKELN